VKRLQTMTDANGSHLWSGELITQKLFILN